MLSTFVLKDRKIVGIVTRTSDGFYAEYFKGGRWVKHIRPFITFCQAEAFLCR